MADSLNPFQSPSDEPRRKRRLNSNPSIENEPHLQPRDDAERLEETSSIWHEPGLSPELQERGEMFASNGEPKFTGIWGMALMVLLFLLATALLLTVFSLLAGIL